MGGFVVYGTAPWDAPWLTEHNLAHALAARHRVLFVEPAVTPLTPFRYGLHAQTRGDLRRLSARRPSVRDGVHVFAPVVLPRKSRARSQALSRRPLRMQVARAAAAAGLAAPVAVAARSALDVLGVADERVLVYLVKDWIEAGPELLGRDAQVLARERDAMCAAADLVCAISPGLRDALADRGVGAEVLPHGFAADLVRESSEAGPVPELDGLPRPILGFTGRVDGRLDYPALESLARAMPHATILLLGPVSPRLAGRDRHIIDRTPNMVLRRPVARERLPGLLASLDCLLMPYRDTLWIRRAAPLKLWDYLYAGPPLVGSGCQVLLEHPPEIVRYVRDPGRWTDTVGAALAEGRRHSAERRALALANTWDRRARELEALVARVEHRAAAA